MQPTKPNTQTNAKTSVINFFIQSHSFVKFRFACSIKFILFAFKLAGGEQHFSCFWALDKSLAYARHYPAINWNDSYSEYLDDLARWYDKNVDHEFNALRQEIQAILHEENQLMEIVKLIGSDVLPEDQKLTMEIAKVIRVGYLQQNAYHPADTYVPFEKQFKMLKIISYLNAQAKKLVARRIPVSLIAKTGIIDKVVKIKYDVPNDQS